MGDLVEMFFPGIRNGFNPEAYIREAQSADFNMQNIHVEPTAIGPVGNVLSTEELVRLHTVVPDTRSDYEIYGGYRESEIDTTKLWDDILNRIPIELPSPLEKEETIHYPLIGEHKSEDIMQKYGILDTGEKDISPYVQEHEYNLPGRTPSLVPYLDSMHHDEAGLLEPKIDHPWMTEKEEDSTKPSYQLPSLFDLTKEKEKEEEYHANPLYQFPNLGDLMKEKVEKTINTMNGPIQIKSLEDSLAIIHHPDHEVSSLTNYHSIHTIKKDGSLDSLYISLPKGKYPSGKNTKLL